MHVRAKLPTPSSGVPVPLSSDLQVLNRSSDRWIPILTRQHREIALERIAAIADALSTIEAETGFESDHSLASGLAGVSLFFAYLPPELTSDRTRDLAANMIERAARSPSLAASGSGLLEGATGVLWALDHLTRAFREPAETDPLLPFDQTILRIVDRGFVEQPYDLITGLTGVGVYALDRYPLGLAESCLVAVIERLRDLAVPVQDGIAWATRGNSSLPLESNRQLYDLGVAHGMAGVIGFLSLAYSTGIRRDMIAELLNGAVSCLLAQERAHELGPRFPYTVSFSVVDDLRPLRIAWCYGDAGIAAALYLAGSNLGVASWKVKALELARNAATLNRDSCGVDDTGICHGSVGLAHIFNRLGQASGDNELLQAARDWYQITLEMWRPREGVAGFPAWAPAEPGSKNWIAEPGLLEGAAGVGLALSAAISWEPAWDSILLTSLPPLERESQ